MRLLLVVSVLALSSCVSANSFTAPDGRKAFVIGCSAMYQTMANCHEKAREMCTGEYDVLNRVEGPGHRSMEVACKS